MRHNKNIFRDKSFLAMAGVSVLALAGIAGGMLLQNKSPKEDENPYIADLNGSPEEISYTDRYGDYHSDKNDNIIANNGSTKNTDKTEPSTSDKATESESASEPATKNQAMQEETTPINNTSKPNNNPGVNEAGAGVSQFSFSTSSKLIWPIESNNVIMDFSPDSTIYFATLDKYKTNDSICLQSSVDTPVYASAPGIIKGIGYNEEIGNNISLDLGSGYTLLYGQIKDIQVKDGDVVNEGDLLCYVANPTKYYTVEGPNLYLKLTDSEKALDPLDYLNFE